MAKIFVSYKYGDNQVEQSLDYKYWAVEKNPYTGVETKSNEATGRAYANFIQEIIGENNTYKGEKQDESLEGKSEEQIWEHLKPRVHDSTVTLVIISRGMKDFYTPESDQWMPNEIRYSLWEVPRGEKTSATNALLGVIIPDRDGRYDYIYGKSNCPHCANINLIDKHNNTYLFNILRGNIFNRDKGGTKRCVGGVCSTTVYDEGHSYLHLVTLEQFKDAPEHHVQKALEIKDNGDEYIIEKTI
ncbi:MAG: hypothetical protein A2481_02715 [Candidatus Yonathbacteria bacterium RIFOXYC2_FULL_47_9]|nr:MAG: hypothetical protein A2481_02715 [Candidatus Yonathbacteria bacterium RIFOXYC2_FULL_47_9]HAT68323.1 hypothetical protein [Candidatus Yonathbacteria bacterium]